MQGTSIIISTHGNTKEIQNFLDYIFQTNASPSSELIVINRGTEKDVADITAHYSTKSLIRFIQLPGNCAQNYILDLGADKAAYSNLLFLSPDMHNSLAFLKQALEQAPGSNQGLILDQVKQNKNSVQIRSRPLKELISGNKGHKNFSGSTDQSQQSGLCLFCRKLDLQKLLGLSRDPGGKGQNSLFIDPKQASFAAPGRDFKSEALLQPGLLNRNEHAEFEQYDQQVHSRLFQDYLARAKSKKDSMALDATILRTASVNGRDLMAWRASNGRFTYIQVVRILEQSRDKVYSGQALNTLQTFDPDWGIRLARILVLQGLEPDDSINGLSLYRALFMQPEAKKTAKRFGRLFCNVAISLGDTEFARQIMDNNCLNHSDMHAVQCDLENPFVHSGTYEAWIELFNKWFTDSGLEPVQVDRSGSSSLVSKPFDLLHAQVQDTRPDGPLVTVIVTAFNPGPELLTSVDSLLAQTYQNLEIIIVDDASSQESREFFQTCRARDQRVKFIRQEKNQGTYAARNIALQHARGEFVAVQDADDWSHPRRIEHQVKPMLENRDIYATRCRHIAANHDLILGVLSKPVSAPTAASLMIRKQAVLDKVGFFDSVRKGADNEFALRIEAATQTRICDLEYPLKIYRRDNASLSGSDFLPGWKHPARRSYHEAYAFWHEQIKKDKASPYLPSEPDTRQFPAPRSFWIDQKKAAASLSYDFVFAGDWRQYGGPQKSMLEEIKALKRKGYRIAVCHLEAYRFMTKQAHPAFCNPVREIINRGEIDEVLPTDPAKISIMILRYPLILQFTSAEPIKWTIEKAYVVINQAPHEVDGRDFRYQVTDCLRNARHLFGLNPVWVPQGPYTRYSIEKIVPPSLLSSENNPAIINTADSATQKEKLAGPRPIIGRHSRDYYLKFPASRSELLQAYPDSPKFDVRILGGSKTCQAICGVKDIPANWTLLPFGAQPVEEFLNEIDFFVYFDHPLIVESFCRCILEAMASGCVVILSEKFKEVFGEGPIYTTPDQVENIVRRLYSQPNDYKKIQQKTLETVQKHFSHDAFVELVHNGFKNKMD